MMTQEIIAVKTAKVQESVAELLLIVSQAVDEQTPAHVPTARNFWLRKARII